MEVDADIVTFIAGDLQTGELYHYLETDLGVAACVIGGDVYSLRLKGGYYESGLTEVEAVRMLTDRSRQLHGMASRDDPS